MQNTKENRLAQREAFIPSGASKIRMKDGAAVFYSYTNTAGQPCALCFIGTAGKPAWHYRFHSHEGRRKRIAEQITILERRQAEKTKRREDARKGHAWGVGKILVSSWGYEQTNVDFYEVTRVIGQTMIEIEKIGSRLADGLSAAPSAMSDYVVADPTVRTGQKSRHRVYEGAISLSSYQSARPWDGAQRYRSWYA
ncbi:MAG: hypothetical protein KGN33_18180 [Paracoccaceae bacterium]|nr:hypothetical protein [Paracoccaceae bacterium]